MTEFVALTALWLAFLVFAARRGTAHLAHPAAGLVLAAGGALAAALFEALPFSAVTQGFTVRTAIAAAAGALAGRLVGRAFAAWALWHPPTESAAPPRLLHPLIAAGLFVAGVPATWHFVTMNHAFLEERAAPRDAATGIVRGAEEVRLEGTSGRAVLLLHDLYGSPADFGDLPRRLHEAGFTVAAPLLPGHGRTPGDLCDVTAAQFLAAAAKEFDALAAKGARVSVVGLRFGGTLARDLAARRDCERVVSAGTYSIEPWCLTLAPLVRYALVSRSRADPERPDVLRTRSLHAVAVWNELERTMLDALPPHSWGVGRRRGDVMWNDLCWKDGSRHGDAWVEDVGNAPAVLAALTEEWPR